MTKGNVLFESLSNYFVVVIAVRLFQQSTFQNLQIPTLQTTGALMLLPFVNCRAKCFLSINCSTHFGGFVQKGLACLIFIFIQGSSIFTARKRSCGKVLFLHQSVSHSVHRGMSAFGSGVCIPLGTHPNTPLGHTHPGHTPPVEIANEAGGMHPTGMHSCYI